jgi:hypothetical protein
MAAEPFNLRYYGSFQKMMHMVHMKKTPFWYHSFFTLLKFCTYCKMNTIQGLSKISSFLFQMGSLSSWLDNIPMEQKRAA